MVVPPSPRGSISARSAVAHSAHEDRSPTRPPAPSHADALASPPSSNPNDPLLDSACSTPTLPGPPQDPLDTHSASSAQLEAMGQWASSSSSGEGDLQSRAKEAAGALIGAGSGTSPFARGSASEDEWNALAFEAAGKRATGGTSERGGSRIGSMPRAGSSSGGGWSGDKMVLTSSTFSSRLAARRTRSTRDFDNALINALSVTSPPPSLPPSLPLHPVLSPFVSSFDDRFLDPLVRPAVSRSKSTRDSPSSLATIPSSPLPCDSSTSVNIFDTLHSTPPLAMPLLSPALSIHSALSTPVYHRLSSSTSAPDLTLLSAPALSRKHDNRLSLAIPATFSLETTEAGRGKDERRYHALVELVETEMGYLESLTVLVRVYFASLPQLSLLSTGDIATVVRNAEDLLKLHQRIVDRLEQVEVELSWRGEGYSNQEDLFKVAAGRVARIFLDELPNFSLYNDFCARHGEALSVIRSVEGRSEWESYERQCATAVGSSMSYPPSPRGSISVALPSLASSLASSPSTSTAALTTPYLSTSSLPSPMTPTTPTSSRLRFHDYAIKPIQRIMRYQLVLSSLLKNLGDSPERTAVKEAWDGMRRVARSVDGAKKLRDGELRTRLVASRMEFQSPIDWAFCDVMGPTLLIGTLHVLHRSLGTEPLKVKYYGCFVYRTHIVLVKIKKRESYEPREWLPLRLFDISSVEEGDGPISHAIRLSYADHHFDLGASGEAEKAVWLQLLTATRTAAQQHWDSQPLDDVGRPTLFDDTIVSSISRHSPPSPTIIIPRRSHARNSSIVSMSSVPFMSIGDKVVVEPRSSSASTSPTTSSFPIVVVPNRSRFSATASSLLGRTPAAQRAAIDLRLADVLSEEVLWARAQTARESMVKRPSNPTRSTTLPQLGMGQPIEGEGEKKWSTSLMRYGSKSRPDLPEIDTRMVEASKPRSSSGWTRTLSLRRATSQSALEVRQVTPPPLNSAAADVERNNSCSSTASSSGTTESTLSSSQGCRQTDTPASSLPSTPNRGILDTDPIDSTSHRWSVAEGVIIIPRSNANKLKRHSRGSLGSDSLRTTPITPIVDPVSETTVGRSRSRTGAALQRRKSTLGEFFQKRVQSSPSLVNFFSPSSPIDAPSSPSKSSSKAIPFPSVESKSASS